MLAIDEAIAAAVAEAAALAADEAAADETVEPPAPRPQSALSVRELQARLRAGRTVEELAKEAGVDTEWVARFASPVLAEQRRVIAATQATVLDRPRLGPSAVPVGEAIRHNLATRGLDMTAEELDEGWSARQLADGRWVVALVYRSRGRRHTATWELDIRSGTLVAGDRLASDIGYLPGPERPPATATIRPGKVPATEPTEGDRDIARRVSATRKATAAQLDEATQMSTRRDAELARLAGARPARPSPAPEPEPDLPVRRRAARKKVPAKKKAPVKKKAQTKKVAKHAARAAKKAAPDRDPVAERLATVRRELEQEISAVKHQRQALPPVVPAAPVSTAEPSTNGSKPSAPRRRRAEPLRAR